MTDRPRTMMLSPSEWRTLVANGAHSIYTAIGQLPSEVSPTKDQIAWLQDTLNRLGMHVSAWAASGQPQPVAQTEKTVQWSQPQDPTDFSPSADMNGTGVASPKKKRGWQKGRKRGPRKPKSDEAVQ